jgi:hypothetical protein
MVTPSKVSSAARPVLAILINHHNSVTYDFLTALALNSSLLPNSSLTTFDLESSIKPEFHLLKNDRRSGPRKPARPAWNIRPSRGLLLRDTRNDESCCSCNAEGYACLVLNFVLSPRPNFLFIPSPILTILVHRPSSNFRTYRAENARC